MSLKAAPSPSSSVRNSERGLPVLQLLDEHCMPIGQPLRSMYPTPINHTAFTVEQRFYSYACLTLLSALLALTSTSPLSGGNNTLWLSGPYESGCLIILNEHAHDSISTDRLLGVFLRNELRTSSRRYHYFGATALTSTVPLQVSGRRVILTSFQQMASLCHLTGSGSSFANHSVSTSSALVGSGVTNLSTL